MTRTTNARIAGFTFLAYIALGIPAMILFGKATHAEGVAAKLASIAQHGSDVRVAFVLNLLCTFAALVLAVTLYAITRDEDADLAMLALTFRVGEGVVGAVSVQGSLGLMWLATATGALAPGTEASNTLGAFLLEGRGSGLSAIFFAVASLIFSWLLLRGRMIPVPLAWLGVLASVLWVVGLPLQLVGVLRGFVIQLMYALMAAFEIPLAFWLLIKGVSTPAKVQSAMR